MHFPIYAKSLWLCQSHCLDPDIIAMPVLGSFEAQNGRISFERQGLRLFTAMYESAFCSLLDHGLFDAARASNLVPLCLCPCSTDARS